MDNNSKIIVHPYDEITKSVLESSRCVNFKKLPEWLECPLYKKFPLRETTQPLVFIRTKIGCSLRPKQQHETFDLDSKNIKTEYNSLHDPHLKYYFLKERNLKFLKNTGQITDNNDVTCNLHEFNEFRNNFLNKGRIYLLRKEYERKETVKKDQKLINITETIAKLKHTNQTNKLYQKCKLNRLNNEMERKEKLKYLFDNIGKCIERSEKLKDLKVAAIKKRNEEHDNIIKERRFVADELLLQRIGLIKRNLKEKHKKAIRNINLSKMKKLELRRKKIMENWEKMVKRKAELRKKEEMMQKKEEQRKLKLVEDKNKEMKDKYFASLCDISIKSESFESKKENLCTYLSAVINNINRVLIERAIYILKFKLNRLSENDIDNERISYQNEDLDDFSDTDSKTSSERSAILADNTMFTFCQCLKLDECCNFKLKFDENVLSNFEKLLTKGIQKKLNKAIQLFTIGKSCDIRKELIFLDKHYLINNIAVSLLNYDIPGLNAILRLCISSFSTKLINKLQLKFVPLLDQFKCDIEVKEETNQFPSPCDCKDCCKMGASGGDVFTGPKLSPFGEIPEDEEFQIIYI